MNEQHVPVDAGLAPVDAGLAPVDADLVPLEHLAPAITKASVSRRRFLGFGVTVGVAAASAAAGARFFPVFAEETPDTTPIVPVYDASQAKWTYIIDTSICIGCGLCAVACKEENHVPEEPIYNRTWIERHVITTDGELYIDSPDGGIDGFPPDSTAPGAAGKPVAEGYFVPRLCMQCSNSPCTSVCPVGATYTTAEGVILVDARRCMGCGYCIVACPYGARYLTPAGDHPVPNDMPGVADKCTWCYHRVTEGKKPACVEVCPVGSRQWGDASNPDDPINVVLAEQSPQLLWPEFGTQPRVMYVGPVNEEA